jgi:hypothetical protein
LLLLGLRLDLTAAADAGHAQDVLDASGRDPAQRRAADDGEHESGCENQRASGRAARPRLFGVRLRYRRHMLIPRRQLTNFDKEISLPIP